MTVEDDLVRAGCDELRAIAARGVHGGDLYLTAVAELERRAHDSEAALESERAAAAARRERQILWMAALIAVGTALVILLFD